MGSHEGVVTGRSLRGYRSLPCPAISADPLEGLQSDLDAHRDFVAARSPAYARLLEVLGPEIGDEVADRLREAWAGRRLGAWYERPLLLLTAIRRDALEEGESHPLAAALRSTAPDLSVITAEAVRAAIGPERRRVWSSVESRQVQTNDPARAIAWIWPAALLARADPGRSIALFDIGASAGLNLVANEIPPAWERSDGGELELGPLPPVASRVGYDLRPLDPLDDEDASWLRASVWPGQDDRAVRLEASIKAFRAAAQGSVPPRIEQATAAGIPARLPIVAASAPRAIAYQTIMRDYLSDDEDRLYSAGMRGWLRKCGPASALWVELEVTDDAGSGGPPVSLTVHVLADGEIQSPRLADCEPHPRVLDVHQRGLDQLGAALLRYA